MLWKDFMTMLYLVQLCWRKKIASRCSSGCRALSWWCSWCTFYTFLSFGHPPPWSKCIMMRMSFWLYNCLLSALASIYKNVLDKNIVVVSNKSKETHKGLFTVPVLTLSKIGTKFNASLHVFYTPDSCVEICLTKEVPYWYLLWSGELGLAGHPAKRLSVWFQMNHALKESVLLCICYRRTQSNQLTNKIDVPTVKSYNYLRFRLPLNASSAFSSPSCLASGIFRGKDHSLSQCCCYRKWHQKILYWIRNPLKELKSQLWNLLRLGRSQIKEAGIQLFLCYYGKLQAIPPSCRAWIGVRKHDERRGNRFPLGLNSLGNVEQSWIWREGLTLYEFWMIMVR